MYIQYISTYGMSSNIPLSFPIYLLSSMMNMIYHYNTGNSSTVLLPDPPVAASSASCTAECRRGAALAELGRKMCFGAPTWSCRKPHRVRLKTVIYYIQNKNMLKLYYSVGLLLHQIKNSYVCIIYICIYMYIIL